MATTGEARVNDTGQMSLPDAALRRWGLDRGGVVGWIDLGDSVLLLPAGLEEVRKELLGAIDWEAARTGFGDPDLADQ